jgi:hypothetical protein
MKFWLGIFDFITTTKEDGIENFCKTEYGTDWQWAYSHYQKNNGWGRIVDPRNSSCEGCYWGRFGASRHVLLPCVVSRVHFPRGERHDRFSGRHKPLGKVASPSGEVL